MKILASFNAILMCITSCGKKEEVKLPPFYPHHFQAYGIKAAPGLPEDPYYTWGPQKSSVPIYMQPLTPNVLIKVEANTLYYGDKTIYNTDTSTFHPTKAGLYYIDEQVTIEGTYGESSTHKPTTTIKFYIQISHRGAPQLWYSDDVTVPRGALVRKKIAINTLICMDAEKNSTAEAFVSVGGDVQSAVIVSQESQFEGYYLGECTRYP